MANNVTLSANQKKALAALLANKSVRDAAQACGLSERTLHRYLSIPTFEAALQVEQSELYNASARRLAAGLTHALDELEALASGAKSESVRLAAVSRWLDLSFRARELIELDKRLKALEEKIT